MLRISALKNISLHTEDKLCAVLTPWYSALVIHLLNSLCTLRAQRAKPLARPTAANISSTEQQWGNQYMRPVEVLIDVMTLATAYKALKRILCYKDRPTASKSHLGCQVLVPRYSNSHP